MLIPQPILPCFCMRQRGIKTLGYSASYPATTPLLGINMRLKMDAGRYNNDCIQRKHHLRSFRVAVQQMRVLELVGCFENPGPSSWCSGLLSGSLHVQKH